MRSRRLVVTVSCLAAAAVVAGPASAKSRYKNIHETYTVTDATPDVSGEPTTGTSTCRGPLQTTVFDTAMADTEHKVVAKAKGELTVETTVTGDWALELYNSKGEMVTRADVNPPDSESIFDLPLTKGTYYVYACNLAGAPTADVTLTYKYK